MQSSTPLHVDLRDLPGQARALVRLRGPDTERFLQGLLSADVAALEPGQAAAAALLTVKGKLISEAIVLCDGGGYALALPADVADAVIDDLDRHIIMDDVTLEPAPEVGFSLVWGTEGWAPSVEVGAFPTAHPAPGLLVVGDEAIREAALAGVAAATPEQFTAHRVATASPAWGFEIRPGFFPPEVGFVGGVSYDKGCYRGQEPLARIHARGQVNRVMVRIRATAAPDGDGPVALASEARPEAGEWTTWVAGEGGVDGLAIVHRSLAAPGTALQAGAIAIEVTSGPLGDDVGMPGKRKGGAATVKLGGRR
ncbi:MAG: folate-binding protein YgfZ [Myxococcales bacterium]|nr:folate-binding protein YgfZ [Myxococcales bacterium]